MARLVEPTNQHGSELSTRYFVVLSPTSLRGICWGVFMSIVVVGFYEGYCEGFEGFWRVLDGFTTGRQESQKNRKNI